MIVDTGVLYALVDADDRAHRAAAAVFALPDPKIVPEPVVVETDQLILARLGVEEELAFLRGLDEGALAVESPRREDRRRAAELMERYADARIGYVDAVVTAIAERLRDVRLATLDRRDFGLIVPRHGPAFEILP